MPELPEVETVRRGLARHLLNQRLHAVHLAREDLRWPLPVAALHALPGRTLRGIERRSKYLLLRLEPHRTPQLDAQVALVHLGMTGRLLVGPLADYDAPWEKHEHWRMRFARHCLRFVDARRFGMLDVFPAAALPHHPLLVRLGPEPLGPHFGADALWTRTRRRRTGAKTFLMDARNVVGVGNIYASEACHRAGIRPRRAAGSLTRDDCARLAAAVRAVLRDAIRRGGTTLRDYVDADAESGWFQLRLAVYGREGEPCRTCGAAIKRVVGGGRSTYYCPRCQR